MVLFSRIVAKQHRRSVVNRDQHVNRTVVIEITERHATCGQGLRKNRAALTADIFKTITRIAKEQHGFAVRHAGHVPFDMIIRVAIAEQQIYIAIIIKIKNFSPQPLRSFVAEPIPVGSATSRKLSSLLLW